MGTGKSTILAKLSEGLPEYKAYKEGQFSPVDLAWCTYNDKSEYQFICDKYKEIEDEIKKWTVEEGDKKIIAYTKILTDIKGFHKFLEQYEVYNGKKSFEEFRNILLSRFVNLDSTGNIFECSFLQNSINEMILFYQLSDEEILEFYKEAFEILKNKEFLLIYLDTVDIEETISIVKRERVDSNGNECWFEPLARYFENSPYGKANDLTGFEGVVKQLKIRRELELRIINEILGDKAIVLKSKSEDTEISNLIDKLI